MAEDAPSDATPAPPPVALHTPTLVALSALKPHPRNYKEHPPEQLAHIVASIRAGGVYRNVVAARDFTLLAGHGVVLAARQMGLTAIPVVVLDVDPHSPAALKVLAGDNEIARLAEQDDRTLTELLRNVKDDDVTGLLGTGYDDQSLAALLFVSRPAEEVSDFDAAAEWVGMPEYDGKRGDNCVLNVQFRTRAERDAFLAKMDVDRKRDSVREMRDGRVFSMWWPPKGVDDRSSLRFEAPADNGKQGTPEPPA
jgi:hypothetical protein